MADKPKYNPDIHHRRSIRLKNYDYSQNGAYFVTMCVQNHMCLFGEITNGKMILNEFGIIVRDEWVKSAEIRWEIGLDEFIIIPNHFHGIVIINGRGDRPVAPTTGIDDTSTIANVIVGHTIQRNGLKQKSIGSFIDGFKSSVTKRINGVRHTPGISVWQRNYYEHIIRNEESLLKIRNYIFNNPINWETDKENPERSVVVGATGRSPKGV